MNAKRRRLVVKIGSSLLVEPGAGLRQAWLASLAEDIVEERTNGAEVIIVTSGAIAGPIVALDLRTLYLEDLTLLGATVMPRAVFEALVAIIEAGEIRPLLAKTFPLAELRAAQAEFLEKAHVGNFVVLP